MLLLQTRGINAANSRLSSSGPVTLAQDAFTRANGTLDGSTMTDGSSTWALGVGGGFSVLSNEANCDANGGAVEYCDSMSDIADVAVSVKWVSGKCGIVARYDHANTYYYRCYQKDADTKVYVDRVDGSGTAAEIANSGATTLSGGEKVTLKCQGAVISILVDDVVKGSVTDASVLAAAGKAGLYGGAINTKVDDFLAESL